MAFRLSSIPSYNLSTDYGNQAGQIADIGASVAEGVEGFRRQRREEEKQRREQELRRQVAEATGRGDYSGAAQGLLSAGRFGDAGSFLKLGSENDARKSDQQLLSSLSAPSGGQRLSDMGRGSPSPPASLIRNESGGRYDARNDAVGAGGMKGHFGRLQFGQARLQEAAAAGAIPQGTTPEQFMASPELQHAAERWHFQDIDNFIRSSGLDKAVGKPVAGTVATVDGMRAVAHLGGKEGLAKFIASNGQYNPADRYGTRLSDYFSRHSGGGAAQEGTPPVQVAQNGVPDSGLLSQDPRIQQLTRALAAARTDEGRRAIEAQLEIAREDARFARQKSSPQKSFQQQQFEALPPDQQEAARRELFGIGPSKQVQPQFKEIELPDGTKRPVFIHPDGRVAPVDTSQFGGQQQGTNPYATGKFNETQGKAASFADRMAASESIIRENENINTGIGGYIAGGGLSPPIGRSVQPGVPGALKSEERKKIEQAQRDFLNAILRKESGAVISESEFENARLQYFPQPGDTPDVRAQKRRNRQIAIEGVAREAGPAYRPNFNFGARGEQNNQSQPSPRPDPLGIR